MANGWVGSKWVEYLQPKLDAGQPKPTYISHIYCGSSQLTNLTCGSVAQTQSISNINAIFDVNCRVKEAQSKLNSFYRKLTIQRINQMGLCMQANPKPTNLNGWKSYAD